MSAPVSIDAIKHGLQQRLDQLVPALFPAARQEKDGWRLGDIHGAPGHSLEISRRRGREGWFKDWQNPDGCKGDVLNLVAAAHGGDMRAALTFAREFLGLGQIDPALLRRREQEAARARQAAERRREADEEAVRRKVKTRFLEAQPLRGTPAERYLAGRGIRLEALRRPPNALRYHPALWSSEAGQRLPAMVALAQDRHGRALALHRTYLAVHPDGRVSKAPLANPKKTLGGYRGGFIAIARGASDTPHARLCAGETSEEPIALTEGIEDALTVAMAMPALRVWCALALDNMALVPAEAASRLYLHRHRDDGQGAIEAVARVHAAWAAKKVPVADVFAPAPFKDFNEWLQARQSEARGAA